MEVSLLEKQNKYYQYHRPNIPTIQWTDEEFKNRVSQKKPQRMLKFKKRYIAHSDILYWYKNISSKLTLKNKYICRISWRAI